MTFTRCATYVGVAIPFWLLGGVLLASHFYPDFDQSQQAMSELGALGAPTHIISPLINNYPLALMFMVFGGAVYTRFRQGCGRKCRPFC